MKASEATIRKFDMIAFQPLFAVSSVMFKPGNNLSSRRLSNDGWLCNLRFQKNQKTDIEHVAQERWWPSHSCSVYSLWDEAYISSSILLPTIPKRHKGSQSNKGRTRSTFGMLAGSKESRSLEEGRGFGCMPPWQRSKGWVNQVDMSRVNLVEILNKHVGDALRPAIINPSILP